ncbi:uncharacterized protein LOC111396507 [Olea europaea var. sylvestris]|uniref:uncharacterized protein LOC111396507 n=1 Tax=Olea europaea var. sylvestris TaxID=158386 RepID=UPI000C1CD33E|nr:uncharacterized protein LOC111396507 [Olea europaea var. sylvestris]
MNKLYHSVLVVLCLGLLILAQNHQLADAQVDCPTAVPNLLPCTDFLSNLLPLLPSKKCCDGASKFTGLGGVDSLCQCLKLSQFVSGILPTKFGLIPNLCGLTGFLPLVNCLVPGAPPKV